MNKVSGVPPEADQVSATKMFQASAQQTAIETASLIEEETL
jgi:hypothetical protein